MRVTLAGSSSTQPTPVLWSTVTANGVVVHTVAQGDATLRYAGGMAAPTITMTKSRDAQGRIVTEVSGGGQTSPTTKDANPPQANVIDLVIALGMDPVRARATFGELAAHEAMRGGPKGLTAASQVVTTPAATGAPST